MRRLGHAVGLQHRHAERSSSCAIVAGESAELHERMKRSVGSARAARRRARQDELVDRRHRRVPGDALCASTQRPEAERIEARRHDDRPAASEASRGSRRPGRGRGTAASRRARRRPASARRCAMMLPTEATRLRWRSGTRFGRLVVPLVCRTSATSSPSGSPAVRPAWRGAVAAELHGPPRPSAASISDSSPRAALAAPPPRRPAARPAPARRCPPGRSGTRPRCSPD